MIGDYCACASGTRAKLFPNPKLLKSPILKPFLSHFFNTKKSLDKSHILAILVIVKSSTHQPPPQKGERHANANLLHLLEYGNRDDLDQHRSAEHRRQDHVARRHRRHRLRLTIGRRPGIRSA